MKFSRPSSLSIITFLFSGLFCAVSIAAEPPKPVSAASISSSAASSNRVLPTDFAGWQVKGTVARSDDPAIADAANTPVLKEYGFQHSEKATYTRDDGRNLTITAIVFDDASGAYGAFTFYNSPDMGEENIGSQAAFLNNRVLFCQQNVLVTAVFDKMSVMSASQLRQLATMLPLAEGGKGKPPLLPLYLPKRAFGKTFEKNTTKYILGPVALDRLKSPLPVAMVDFNSGAEVVIGKYAAPSGDATLMIVEYPTPQIAADRLRQIDALHQTAGQTQVAATIADVGPFFDIRSGPIIAIASGPLSKSEANSLLSPISYEADVTWNENTYLSKKNNVANFLFNAILLSMFLIGLSLVAGIAFGGVRLLVKRFFPDSVFDRPETMEFISLHLDDTPQRTPEER